jgi:hypothetical protein
MGRYVEVEKMSQDTKVIVPFRAPMPPKPEPKATLTYEGVTIELDLTYLHHLNVCGGWGDRASSFWEGDQKMKAAMEGIERAMWKET